MRLLLLVVCVFSISFSAQHLVAQQPLRDLFEEIDKNRPKGKLLKQLFGGSGNSGSEANNPQRQQSSQRSNLGQPYGQRQPNSPQPTLAQPNSRPNPNNIPQHVRQPEGPNPNSSNNYYQPFQATNARSNDGLQNQSLNQGQTQSQRRPQSPGTNNTSTGQRDVRGTVALGVKLSPARSGNGLLVDQVAKGGPFAAAGIVAGDIITAFGGLEITSQEEFDDILSVLGLGDQIEIEYVRRGKSDKAFVQFGEPQLGDDAGLIHGSPKAGRSTGSSSRDYDPIVPPVSTNSRSPYGSNPGSQSPISVLSNLHDSSTPTIQPRNSNQQQLEEQIREMRRIIDQQQRTIEQLQNQAPNSRTSNNSAMPTLAPPAR